MHARLSPAITECAHYRFIRVDRIDGPRRPYLIAKSHQGYANRSTFIYREANSRGRLPVSATCFHKTRNCFRVLGRTTYRSQLTLLWHAGEEVVEENRNGVTVTESERARRDELREEDKRRSLALLRSPLSSVSSCPSVQVDRPCPVRSRSALFIPNDEKHVGRRLGEKTATRTRRGFAQSDVRLKLDSPPGARSLLSYGFY